MTILDNKVCGDLRHRLRHRLRVGVGVEESMLWLTNVITASDRVRVRDRERVRVRAKVRARVRETEH